LGCETRFPPPIYQPDRLGNFAGRKAFFASASRHWSTSSIPSPPSATRWAPSAPRTCSNALEGPYAGPNTRLGLATVVIWRNAEHYGQMTLHLRLNGFVPPAALSRRSCKTSIDIWRLFVTCTYSYKFYNLYIFVQ